MNFLEHSSNAIRIQHSRNSRKFRYLQNFTKWHKNKRNKNSVLRTLVTRLQSGDYKQHFQSSKSVLKNQGKCVYLLSIFSKKKIEKFSIIYESDSVNNKLFAVKMRYLQR